MNTLRLLWARNRWLVIAFVVALLLTVGFAIRSAIFFPRFSGPPTDPAIEAWMTPRLVAMGWQLPPEILDDALGIPPHSGKGRTLGQIAAEQGISIAELATRIETTAKAYRATLPPDKRPPEPQSDQAPEAPAPVPGAPAEPTK